MPDTTASIDAILVEADAFAEPGADAPRPGALRLVRAMAESGLRLLLLGEGPAGPPFETALDPAPGDLAVALDRLGLRPERAGILAATDRAANAARRAGFGQVVRLGEADEAADLVARDAAELAVAGRRLAARTLHSVPDADPDTVRRLLAGRRPAVFLDYDGVLTPIVADHTKTALHPPMREALAGLAAACPTAAVSGRDLADLRRLIGLEGMYYAGSHGFEIAAPDGSVWGERGLEFLPDLDAAEAELRGALASVPGHGVDRKRFSVAVHYRNVAAPDVAMVAQTVDRVLAAHPRLRKGLGKKVYEIQPRLDWNKGRAVRWLIERLSLERPEILPIYVGDDITDETAFRALAGDGLGIVVRDAEDRPTAADLGVADVPGVEALLRLVASLAAGSPK